jgi:hypothetical protein
MTELDFESDAFLTVLTEALRAGPGTPQWHDAVRTLRAGGIQHADEYRMLVIAREHLDAGKEYRSVRAGPGFSQKLMAAIEAESAGRGHGSPPTSTTIAAASAAIMLLVLLAIGYLLWHAAGRTAGGNDGTTILTDTVTRLGEGSATTLPADWRAVGGLDFDLARSSIKASPATHSSPTGGALMYQRSIDPSEPFSVAAAVRIQRADDNLVAQVFITDDPAFSEENATTAHELVWSLKGNRAQVVVPSGRVEAQTDLPGNPKDPLLVRVMIDGAQTTVSLNNKPFWSGPNGLEPDKPRYVGIRFLQRENGATDSVVFQVVRVNMRPK